jgi:ferredoxin-NADP reductase
MRSVAAAQRFGPDAGQSELGDKAGNVDRGHIDELDTRRRGIDKVQPAFAIRYDESVCTRAVENEETLAIQNIAAVANFRTVTTSSGSLADGNAQTRITGRQAAEPFALLLFGPGELQRQRRHDCRADELNRRHVSTEHFRNESRLQQAEAKTAVLGGYEYRRNSGIDDSRPQVVTRSTLRM